MSFSKSIIVTICCLLFSKFENVPILNRQLHLHYIPLSWFEDKYCIGILLGIHLNFNLKIYGTHVGGFKGLLLV